MRVPGQAPLWRRLLHRHRRPLAAVLAGAAALLALVSLRPPDPPTVAVLVTRADVAPGQVLGPSDVEVAAWPPGVAPAGVLTSFEELPDRPVAAPLVAGEPLLPERFLAPSMLAVYGAGLVAAPVRLADAGSAGLLRAGDIVDVLAATAATMPEDVGTAARTVASRVRVLLAGVDHTGATDGLSAAVAPSDGALVVLLTTQQTAAEIAGAAVTSRLSVVLRSTEG